MSYQPIVLPASLKNKAYQEVIDTITRNDTTIAEEAIDTAIQEAKMYLSRYDIIQLFGDKENDISATFSDAYLTNLIKDMALWQLFALSNPNINLELARTKYMDAIKALTRIQDRKSDPKWPYLDTTGQTAPKGDAITYISNPPRKTHF